MKVRTQARRDAIVEEAKRLFLELGYERATMSELTRRLGGSKATLYGYFASKRELFVAVTESMAAAHMAEAEAELQQLARLDLASALALYGECLLRLTTADDAQAMVRMILSESGPSEVGDLFVELGPRRAIAALTAAFQRAMDRGDMQAGPAATLAVQFLALVRAEVELRAYQRQPPLLLQSELHLMARRAVQLFLGGYRAVAAAGG
jgi:AcrR family transcriptional regulator